MSRKLNTALNKVVTDSVKVLCGRSHLRGSYEWREYTRAELAAQMAAYMGRLSKAHIKLLQRRFNRLKRRARKL